MSSGYAIEKLSLPCSLYLWIKIKRVGGKSTWLTVVNMCTVRDECHI